MVSGSPSITPLNGVAAVDDDDNGFLGVVKNFLAASHPFSFAGGDEGAAGDWVS